MTIKTSSATLAAFLLGALLGMVLPGGIWISFAEALSRLWIIIILLIAIPLVTLLCLKGLATILDQKVVGQLAFIGLGIHILYLLLGTIVSIGLSLLFLLISPIELSQLSIPGDQEMASSIITILHSFQSNLVPIFIPLILSTIPMSFLLLTLNKKWRKEINKGIDRMSSLMMNVLKVVLRFLPLIILCMAYKVFFEGGYLLAGVSGFYIVAVSSILLIMSFILKSNLLVFKNRRQLFRSLRQAELTAITTSSSMASAPSMIMSLKEMGVPSKVGGASISFFASFFRLNLMVSNPFSYLLLLRIYDMPFDPAVFALFLGTMFLTSFGSPGLPQTGNVYSLPVFLAAGIPIEGLLILKALDAIPDIFKTLLNVTEISIVGLMSYKIQVSMKRPLAFLRSG